MASKDTNETIVTLLADDSKETEELKEIIQKSGYEVHHRYYPSEKPWAYLGQKLFGGYMEIALVFGQPE